MKHTFAFLLSLCLLSGCADNPGDLSRKDPGPVKRPPNVPATRNVQGDLRLFELSRREISAAAASDDPFVKAHAIEAIQNVMPGEGQAEIFKGLKDTNRVVRFAATMAAGQLKLDDVRPELLELADDVEPTVRIAAAYALHRLGDYRYSKDLEKYSQDPNPEVRGNTALVLGMLGEESAINVLKPMQRDRNVAVTLAVAEAMWRLGNTDARDRLIATTINSNPGYAMVAMLALGAPRDTSVRGNIRTNLTAEYPEVCLVAARVVGQLKSDEGYGIAMKYSDSKDARQRALAALAFGEIGRMDAQEYLEPLLKDKDGEVRIAAATALLQLKRAER